MMWSDKAFGIWMGHAGEDAQVFTPDEVTKDVTALERTQVLAIARRETVVAEPRARTEIRDCDAEAIAA